MLTKDHIYKITTLASSILLVVLAASTLYLYDLNVKIQQELNSSSSFRLGEHFVITYSRDLVPEEYVDAILNICEQAWYGYFDRFLLQPHYERIVVILQNETERQAFAFKGTIYIRMPPKENLTGEVSPVKKIPKYRALTVLTHEIAHTIFETDIMAFNEGWANYAAWKVMPYVQEKLGEDMWPLKYNVTEVDIDVLLNSILEGSRFLGTSWAAARIFYEIDQKYGARVIGDAVRITKPTEKGFGCPYKYDLDSFRETLVTITHDAWINELFEKYGFS